MLAWLGSQMQSFVNPKPIFSAFFALACSAAYYGLFVRVDHLGMVSCWPVALLFYFVLLELAPSVPGFYRRAAVSLLAISLITVPFSYLARYSFVSRR
jgi:hypothetical protein